MHGEGGKLAVEACAIGSQVFCLRVRLGLGMRLTRDSRNESIPQNN